MRFSNNDDILKRYLEDIRQTKPLSRQEEQSLFKLVAQGNEAAKQKIISSNMRFVLKVALQYRGSPIPLPDLVSEGAMGLARAIDGFDSSRGLKFISYGVWWIKAYITRAINEQGNLVRLPANQHLRIRRALQARNKGLEVSDDVQELIQMGQAAISFDAPISDDSNSSYAEVLADENYVGADDKIELKAVEELTREIVANLPEREARVISGIYGINQEAPLPLRRVGESLNISHERVRQLRDQALRRIRRSSMNELLQEKFQAYVEAKA
ncbi:MAG: sigma-70 family RNA polymerase sigma factor [Fibrobacter sp.]|nr:sigma-70 family RNA polymerase sigma factor [Fibrobacter sp.]